MSIRRLKVLDFDQRRRKIMRYRQAAISTEQEMLLAMKSIIGERAGILRPDGSRFYVTFGSCFAVNLASALAAHKANVVTTRVTEDVNSPSNNVAFLRGVFLKEPNRIGVELQLKASIDYDELRRQFAAATDIVFTLGNTFYLRGSTGRTVLTSDDCTLQRESFSEILNKPQETPQENDFGAKCMPWVALAVLYVIGRAFYFLFIHYPQLP